MKIGIRTIYVNYFPAYHIIDIPEGSKILSIKKDSGYNQFSIFYLYNESEKEIRQFNINMFRTYDDIFDNNLIFLAHLEPKELLDIKLTVNGIHQGGQFNSDGVSEDLFIFYEKIMKPGEILMETRNNTIKNILSKSENNI